MSLRHHTAASTILLTTAFFNACTERSSGWPGHETPPSITVRVPVSTRDAFPLDTVRYIRAPAIEFGAILEPDLNHPTPATSTQAGRVTWIRPGGQITQGDSVAVIAPLAETEASSLARAPDSGTWWPRARQGQTVWHGDVIGTVQGRRVALALGSVSDLESEFVHVGDSAVVVFPDGEHPPHAGRVEWVRRPEPGRGFAAEVGVEIPHQIVASRSLFVDVTVVPTSPGDSVYGVPASAVAVLSRGWAVFTPVGGDSYQVRWIVPRRATGEFLVVVDGLERSLPVVTGGLASLSAAAEDSLRAMRARSK